jgi:hypothetical protein
VATLASDALQESEDIISNAAKEIFAIHLSRTGMVEARDALLR